MELITVVEIPQVPTPQWEAVQLADGNLNDVAEWVGGKAYPSLGIVVLQVGGFGGYVEAAAGDGDWVVRRPDGFFFVRTDEQFTNGFVELITP